MSASSSPGLESRVTGRAPVKLARSALAALWFGLIPALLALVWLRYSVPDSASGSEGVHFAWLARLRSEQPIWVLLGLFVAAAAMLRYWARQLRVGRALFPPQRPQNGVRRLGSLAAAVLVAALLGLGLRSFVARTHRVEGTSMLPGLENGDLLAVNQLAYRVPFGGSVSLPRRGDLIVFRREGPGSGGTLDVVKRVIGLPGDRVELGQGRPVVNGFAVPHCQAGPYVRFLDGSIVYGKLNVEFLDDAVYLTLDGNGRGTPDFAGFTVPPGQVFALGDDRDNSMDSRNLAGGKPTGLPLQRIEGRVDRALFRQRETEAPLSARIFRPIELGFRQDGTDTSAVHEAIRACVATRPSETRPPAPGSPAPSRGPDVAGGAKHEASR